MTNSGKLKNKTNNIDILYDKHINYISAWVTNRDRLQLSKMYEKNMHEPQY